MCRISVIVPVYNVREHICSCMVSLLAQTFDSYEIIVVDDGSTDGSIAALGRMAADPKVRIVIKENAGTSQARKAGFELARGEYIVFVDSDDRVDPDMLRRLFDAAEREQADMVCCGLRLERTDGALIDEQSVDGIYVYETAADRMRALHSGEAVYPILCNKMIHRSLLERAVFPTGLFIGEDYTMVVPMLEQARRVVHIPDVLYHYIFHGANITRRGFEKLHVRTFANYRRIWKRLHRRYPQCRREIACFHLLEEMTCYNRMIRADRYHAGICRQIIKDIRRHIRWYVWRRDVKAIYRASAAVLSICPRLYRAVYKRAFTILHYES